MRDRHSRNRINCRKYLHFLLGISLLFQVDIPVYAAQTPPTYEEYRSGASAVAENARVTVSVSTEEDLYRLAQACRLDSWSRDKQVELENDIELRQYRSIMIPDFGGIFDGNGHKISGLTLTDAGSAVGLFRYLQAGAKVYNLAVQGRVEPEGTRSRVGGIVGVNYGAVSNCVFTGMVSGDTEVGGIAGINMDGGDIRRCQSDAEVIGNHSTGGIVGSNQGTVSMCKNGGDINTFSEEVSYDLDDLTMERLEDINNTANVTAHTDSGGIAGISFGKVYACVNYGTVGYSHVGYNVGGIVGRLSQGYLSDCVNEGHVLGRKDVGGIVGQMEPFLEVQYLTDKLQELDRETDKLFDLIDASREDMDGYGSQVTDIMKSMTDHLDASRAAGSSLLNTAEELWYIYNHELTGIGKDLRQLVPKADKTEEEPESAAEPVSASGMAGSLETTGHIPARTIIRTSNVTEPDKDSDKGEDDSGDDEKDTDTDDGKSGGSDGVGEGSEAGEIGGDNGEGSEAGETGGDNGAGNEADETGGDNGEGSEADETGGDNGEGSEVGETGGDNGEGSGAGGSGSGNGSGSGTGGSSGNINLGHLVTKDDLESYFAALKKCGVSIGQHLQKISGAGSDRSEGLADDLDTFNDELRKAGDDLDRLTEVLDEGKASADSNMDAISRQLNVVRGLVKGIRDDLFAYEGITVEDASDEPAGEDTGNLLEDGEISPEELYTEEYYDTVSFQKGKIEGCRNEALVEADAAVGGIVGQVAIEYDLDPEDDLSYTGEESFNIERKVKAVVRDNLNRGEVIGKRDYVGGIVGKADFGAIISCESYGNVSSTGGSKVGGIAGASDYAIRSCYSMGRLSGKNQIGGIVGKGCDVFYSYAYNQMEVSGECGGSIAGTLKDDGTLYGNYYVENSRGGVDGIGYQNGATPLTYDEFRSIQEVPDAFSRFRVVFRTEEEELGVVECGYGESVDPDRIPDIPEREGYYGIWPEFEFDFITGNEVLEAEYERWLGSLTGEAQDEQGRSLILVEGEFLPGVKLETLEHGDATELVITQPVLLKGQIQEEYVDYRKPIKVRVFCENAEDTVVEVEQNGSYVAVDTEVMGSYVVFSMAEPGAFRVTVRESGGIFILVTAVVLGLALAVLLVVRAGRKRGAEKQDGQADDIAAETEE